MGDCLAFLLACDSGKLKLQSVSAVEQLVFGNILSTLDCSTHIQILGLGLDYSSSIYIGHPCRLAIRPLHIPLNCTSWPSSRDSTKGTARVNTHIGFGSSLRLLFLDIIILKYKVTRYIVVKEESTFYQLLR